jgi:hypothetical protein
MNDSSAFWRTDPATFRDVVLDRYALENAIASGCPPIDRVRFLTLLNREEEALQEGFGLLAVTTDRVELLLVLAQAFQHRYRWYEAAQLQEEALQRASTRVEEACVRHHIGRRLFDEARYRDAAAEFQWQPTSTGSPAANNSPNNPDKPCNVPTMYTPSNGSTRIPALQPEEKDNNGLPGSSSCPWPLVGRHVSTYRPGRPPTGVAGKSVEDTLTGVTGLRRHRCRTEDARA